MMRQVLNILLGMVFVTTVFASCSIPPPSVMPTQGAMRAPFVLASETDSLRSDKELDAYPTVQHLINPRFDTVFSVFLPSKQVAPGTLLIVMCDNKTTTSPFFKVHFDHADSIPALMISGEQTNIFLYGNDGRWRLFDLE
jgi:hypothetical protein